jgi:endo-1,4-beta-xylanase
VFQDATGAPMTATAANKALLLARLEAHIRGVVGHYGADIGVWDVVNEVIDEGQADGMRRSPWYLITGLDYIRTAFRVAHEVAPTAKLFINDYNTNVPAKRDKLYALVAQLRSEGVPVDGVGHQMHVNIDWPSVAETEAMLQKFIPLGVDQQITEMDVSIYTSNSESFPTPPADRLLKQANRYRDLFALYRKYAANISSVTLWGLADDDTWLDTFPVTRNDAPLLFDDNLQAKPAYWGVVDPSRIGSGTSSPSVSPSVSRSPSPSVSASRSVSPSVSVSVSPSRSVSPSVSPSRSVSPAPSGTRSPCTVTYKKASQWTGGFQGEVTIACTQNIAQWTVGWTFLNGQKVGQLWNGSFTQTGAQVTATNASWNARITPGAPVTFGFIASWTGTNDAPTAFTINGASSGAAEPPFSASPAP